MAPLDKDDVRGKLTSEAWPKQYRDLTQHLQKMIQPPKRNARTEVTDALQQQLTQTQQNMQEQAKQFQAIQNQLLESQRASAQQQERLLSYFSANAPPKGIQVPPNTPLPPSKQAGMEN